MQNRANIIATREYPLPVGIAVSVATICCLLCGYYLVPVPLIPVPLIPPADGFGVFVCVSIMSDRRVGGARLQACGGDEGIPEGRVDAEANECPKAICEHLALSKLSPE